MYGKILVGTDGSATAAKAVARAVDVAKSHNSELTIFTASRKDRGENVVTEAAKEHADAGIQIATKVVDTDPVSGLLAEATGGKYDLLVMGNKGMTGVTRFFKLGNVPNKVTHNLPCSLLIVKTT
jgi:nucleotide-binding universal stress UspA family protein